MMNFIAQVLYKFRFVFFILIIAVTIALTPFLKMEQDNTMRVWFEKTDPTYVNYKNFQEEFNISEFELVVLKATDIFSYEILQYIKEKTFELKNVGYVERVYSLANANKIVKIQEGIEVKPLLEELNENAISKIKMEALNDELFKNYLISEDGKVACIIVTTDKELEAKQQEKHKIVAQIKGILQKGKPDGLELYFSGDLEATTTFDKYSEENLTKFPLLIILLMFICIVIIYKSISMFFIILTVILLSLIWAIGIYTLLGYTFSTVTGMLIPFVLILSIADSIHIIEYFKEMKRLYGLKRKELFINTIKYIIKPCFLTSLTTALGLLSLTISDVSAVRNFGIGAAIGVMCAFIITIGIIPLILSLLPQKDNEKSSEELILAKPLLHLIEHKASLIFLASIIIFIFVLFGITKLKVSSNHFEFYPADSPIVKSTKLIDKALSGNRRLELLLEGNEDALMQPEILKKMEKLSSEIQKLPHIKKVISLVDYIKEINKSLTGEYKIPMSKEVIAQELFLFTLSNEGLRDIESFTTMDYSKGRITINIEAISSEKIQILTNLINKKTEKIFQDTDIKFTITGETEVWSKLHINLTRTQINSFSLAFLLIIGLMFIIFKSLVYGMVSILPNILPIFLCLGSMGWLGIKLDVATVTVASIALGIVVDDTIHFISRLIEENKKGRLIKESIRNVIIYAGRAIIFTSIINIVGFSVLLFADFKPTAYFGALVSLILFFALIGDLLILPATIGLVGKYLEQRNKGNNTLILS